LLLILLALGCLPGCGGCGTQTPAQQAAAAKQKAEADAKKAAEKKQEPFEIAVPTPLLSELLVEADAGRSLRLAKPGHWTTTIQRMRANDDNFEGRTTLAAIDAKGRPLPLPSTAFAMTSSRPVLLAKGIVKRVLNELLLPSDAKQPHVHAALSAGAEVDSKEDRWTLMPSHQYFLLVLAREPARYAFLKVSDSVRAPYEDDSGVNLPHYRVVLADAAKPLPLPANVLTWTSVAYIVWDEVSPDRLDTAQQQALVDWIHWGGRLIINGPDSLATLRGSFLDPYLPADPGKSRSVTSDDVAPLSDFWSRRTSPDPKPVAPIAVTRPWSGVELSPRPDARAVAGADGLFVERAVGSGTIVVSAVQLAERDLVTWPGYDGFLNGALLRRPPRAFRTEEGGMWVGLQTIWSDPRYGERSRDAHFTTPLRWFARDAAAKANARQLPVAQQSPTSVQTPGAAGYGVPIAQTETVVDRPGGLGEWNDFGAASEAARDALTAAAGVRVPGASFVVVCLALYLVVLVPLNWMLFHALGRIEWAWIAAPIIAIAGAVAVVRQAQLDIGFVRSQTEIALLELQCDRPRGHLSRYSALYSSLSTVYDVELEDPTAVATPFPSRRDGSDRGLFGLGTATIEFENYDHPRLRNVVVSSASTQFIHGEQMFPLAGPLRLSHPSTNAGVWQLENRTGFELSDAVVVRRRPPNNKGQASYDACWLGAMRNGTSQLLAWKPVTPTKDDLLFAAEREAAAKVDLQKRLNVDGLLKLAFRFPDASDPLYGAREEYRLVARLDQSLPGSTTTPAASQVTGSTVVLAHLRCELPPSFGPDFNSPADVLGDRPRDAYDESLPLEEELEGED
jgi:hypothetical protein